MSFFAFTPYRLHCLPLVFGSRVSAVTSRHALQYRATKVSAKRKKGIGKGREGDERTPDVGRNPDADAYGDEEQSSQGHRIAVGEQEKAENRLSRSGKEIGWKFLPKDDIKHASAAHDTHDTQQEVLYPFQEAADAISDQEQLPAVSRGQVFAGCFMTSAVLVAFAFLLRARAASLSAAILHTDPAEINRLLSLPVDFNVGHCAVALGCAALVSGARLLLLDRWPAFAEATDKSNQQVLQNLAPFDLLWVSFLPGISEELLFRGSLIPSLYPDWRGVLIAGVGFGVLHNSGGRNCSFAGWASIVGILYGFAFVQTQDIFVPMGAHSLANLVSASLWLKYRSKDR